MRDAMTRRFVALGALVMGALGGPPAAQAQTFDVSTPAGALRLAQAESGGGSAGELSRPPPPAERPPARRSAPERAPPPPRPPSSAANYDGVWSVVSVAETCSGGSRMVVAISSGRITGANLTGQVSGNGSVRAVFSAGGIVSVSTGRLSARSGGGRFRQTDGCVGRWTASKQ
jgi:hypothetical protein